MGIPVASLVRVSTTGQAGDDRGGLPRQRAAVGEAVRRHGLTVVRAFELPGVGGDRVSTTPAWAEIRALLAQGRIRGVVCDAVDRLCRASDLDLTVLADLQRHGASIWTPGEVRDLSSATDGLLAGLLALLGGVEKSAITRRAWEGKRARRQAGRWTQSLDHLPVGVSFDRTTGVWSYTDEALPIAELARRFAAGEGSIRSIAASLGIPYWRARDALRHPLYRGRMSDLGGGWVTVLDPPLVDSRLAALVDARLAKRERKYQGDERRGGDDPYLLRDALVCARCGQRMDTVVNRKKDAARGKVYEWRSYRCSGANRRGMAEHGKAPCDGPMMPIDDVHGAVAETLLASTAHLEAWTAAEAALEAEPDDRRAEIERLRARVADLEGQRGRLLKAYMREIIGEGEFERERAEVDRLLSALTVALRGLEVEVAEAGVAQDALVELYGLLHLSTYLGDHRRLLGLLRQAGARIAVDRVRSEAVGPGVAACPARRAGWSTVLRSASVDVGRVLTIGALELTAPIPAEGRTGMRELSRKWPRT